MSRQNVVYSTCGTSLVTNSLDKSQTDLGKAMLSPVLSERHRAELASVLTRIEREVLASADVLAEAQKRSAELNVLTRLPAALRADEHVFIVSDTEGGRLTAEVLVRLAAKVLGQDVSSFSVLQVGGLRPDDAKAFRAALSELLADVYQRVEADKARKKRVLFNLTGGFKSVNGFLQSLAMMTADRCIYLFENAAELMSIPRLPIPPFDPVQVATDAAPLFRRLEKGDAVSEGELVGVPETLFDVVDGAATSSVWGDFVWAWAKEQVLSGGLLEPVSRQVVFTPAFRKSVEGCEKSRLRSVNDSIAALCVSLRNRTPIEKSSTFKAVQGKGDGVYEIYVGNGADKSRIFGTLKGDVFTAEKLGDHL